MDKPDYSGRKRLSDRHFRYTCNIGINSDDVHCTTSYSTCEEVVQNSRRKWPSLIWLILKILCVFYHRKVTRKRICYSCYVKQVSGQWIGEEGHCKQPLLLDPICLEYEYDGENWTYENHAELLDLNQGNQTRNCEVCNMTLCHIMGEPREYSESDIGVATWNSPYSKFFSFVGIAFAIAVISYDLVFYLNGMFGNPQRSLHLMSYTGFLICLSTYPALNLCSKLRSFLGEKENVGYISWATTLNLRFIIRRLQVLHLSEKGLPGKIFFLFCVLWPSCNALYRVCVYVFILKPKFTVHHVSSLAGVGTVMFVWGCFVYVLYLMRLSFQREFMVLVRYIKKKEGDLDNCRNCLNHVMIDFKCFREFIVVYMAVTVPFTVLEVTTYVTWQYTLRETCQFLENDTLQESSINILIWSNTAMLIVLNVIAIGGLDVNHVWDNFLLNVIQQRSEMHCSFWRKIFAHVKRNQGDFSAVNLTLVISLVGFYMGLKLGDDQEVLYGQDDPKCDILNITQDTMVAFNAF